MNHPKCLLITTVLGLACLGALAPTAVAVAADPDIPEPGLYWRSPRPDSLGNLNYAVGARAELHAAPVELARVDRVVYFAGGSVLGQVTNPPYSFDWTVAGSGAVILRAEARDGAGAVQGWCERTIQVVGEGLQVAQSALAVSVASGATTTVNLDLTNLGPGDTEWAVHIQGGTTPGGTAGNIDRTFTNPNYESGFSRQNDIYSMTYRDRGTADTSDDEIWVWDGAMNLFPFLDQNRKLRRRAPGDWQELGIFTGNTTPCYLRSAFFAGDGDGLWYSFMLLDPNTGNEVRSTPWPQSDVYLWGGREAHAPGVFYVYYNRTDDGGQTFPLRYMQIRDRDGEIVAAHGEIPAWTKENFAAPAATFWSMGHLWGCSQKADGEGRISIWRWRPGMNDAVLAVSVPPTSTRSTLPLVCAAAEPGFVWVTTGYGNGVPQIYHLDTGVRPWLKLAEPRGTLANGAGHTVSLQIDATTAPTGTYQAVLAITQYPNSAIPQILVPVTLTVTTGGGNQPPTLVSPAWAAPAAVTLPAGTTVHVVASDPDGDQLTYAWSKISGPGTATFATPDATDSGVTFSAVGTYALRVAVSDGRGGNVTSDVSVAVTSDVDARADCNGDGVVNALDLQIVIANFGKTVP